MTTYRRLALLFTAFPVLLLAQEIRITKTTATKASIDLSGFKAEGTAGTVFMGTLNKDLQQSGWFNLTRPGAYTVSGAVQESGGSLQAPCLVTAAGTQPPLLNKTFTGRSEDPRQLAHVVSDAILFAIKGVHGMAGTRLVLVGQSGGNKELYLCDADGQRLQPLTRDSSISLSPTWFPSGDRIAYTSFRRGFPDAYVIALSPLNRSCVANYPGINMVGAVSPSGREIALVLSKDGNPDLYIKSLGGGSLTRLTSTRSAGEASPSWSPDGSQIVYVSDRSGSPQLYVISRSGGAERRLTSAARGSENVAPDWGNSGLIAYASKRGGRYQVCTLDPHTGEDRQISTGGGDWEDPSWAPDGRHIACAHGGAIYVLDTLGDPPLSLPLNGATWRSPAWSPR